MSMKSKVIGMLARSPWVLRQVTKGLAYVGTFVAALLSTLTAGLEFLMSWATDQAKKGAVTDVVGEPVPDENGPWEPLR